MFQERIKKTGMAFVNALNAHDLGVWQAVLAKDFTAMYPPTGPAVLNKEAASKVNQGFLNAFPDLKLEVERVLVDGNFVAVYWIASGTHTGPLATENGDIPTTGRQGAVRGVYTAEIKDSQVVREWTYWDQVALLMQLGLMPSP